MVDDSGLRISQCHAAELSAFFASHDRWLFGHACVRTHGDRELAVDLAMRYSGRGMPFLDLCKEGDRGLALAVEKFDHTKGYRFPAYATWWIRQAILRAIGHQNSGNSGS